MPAVNWRVYALAAGSATGPTHAAAVDHVAAAALAATDSAAIPPVVNLDCTIRFYCGATAC